MFVADPRWLPIHGYTFRNEHGNAYEEFCLDVALSNRRAFAFVNIGVYKIITCLNACK